MVSGQLKLRGVFDRQGYGDDHTAASRGHALMRTARSMKGGQLWLAGDLNILRQDPASPHPRVGTELSPAVPVDANNHPARACPHGKRLPLPTPPEPPLFRPTSPSHPHSPPLPLTPHTTLL